ncbi:MAG: adenine phosphoribosyltransferase [Candidatus Thermoplasmatota archaeon]|nr:adenine phosphoribosyltransferase [Candidatus Thermoplasmatota archaeon]MBS3790748.1 adenine phosphoribosyltransferase [Candidatus Thermoplasmatota archaeon]
MLEKLKKSVRECPVVEIEDYHYFIHPLSDGLPLVEQELMHEVVQAVKERADLECDYILTAQSMGFPLAAALSMETGLPYKFIRKRKYGLDGEIAISQTTGYSENEMYLNFVEKEDKVFLIDDVLSTGGTLKSIIKTLQDLDVDICDVMVVFEKVGTKKSLEEELGVKIKSLLKVKMEGSEVKIVD